VRANRFRLRVREVGDAATAAERARAILARLAEPPGAPNWFGEQRFGRDGDNAAKGLEIVKTGTLPRDRRLARLLVSALQSELFNAWLTARLADGLYATAIAGDVLHKRAGGMFDSTEPAVDGARVAAGEVVPTGPMFGDRMRRPADGSAAAAREAAILADAGLSRDSFAAVHKIAEGTRRDAAIAIDRPTVECVDDTTIDVAFALPSGAYATVVMREVMKRD
jgi:tRNA pseudouridine13 synthase